jgi:hypothetical protein
MLLSPFGIRPAASLAHRFGRSRIRSGFEVSALPKNGELALPGELNGLIPPRFYGL